MRRQVRGGVREGGGGGRRRGDAGEEGTCLTIKHTCIIATIWYLQTDDLERGDQERRRPRPIDACGGGAGRAVLHKGGGRRQGEEGQEREIPGEEIHQSNSAQLANILHFRTTRTPTGRSCAAARQSSTPRRPPTTAAAPERGGACPSTRQSWKSMQATPTLQHTKRDFKKKYFGKQGFPAAPPG